MWNDNWNKNTNSDVVWRYWLIGTSDKVLTVILMEPVLNDFSALKDPNITSDLMVVGNALTNTSKEFLLIWLNIISYYLQALIKSINE